MYVVLGDQVSIFPFFQVLMFACLPYTLGWVTTSLAKSVYVLYLSRLFVGISHALLTTTVYTVLKIIKRKSFSRKKGIVSLYILILFIFLGRNFVKRNARNLFSSGKCAQMFWLFTHLCLGIWPKVASNSHFCSNCANFGLHICHYISSRITSISFSKTQVSEKFFHKNHFHEKNVIFIYF